MQLQNFPSRLKSARQLNGLSLRGLASLLDNKLSPQAISHYENGITKPTRKNVLLFCQVLGVPMDYFHRPSIELKEIEFRELEKLPVKQRQQVEAKAEDFLARYLELEDLLGAENRFKNPLSDNLIRNYEDVENRAILLRKCWKLGENPIPNVVELLEEHGIKVCEVVADDAFSGMVATVQEGIHVMVLNAADYVSVDRKRFTALHELAHILLEFEEDISKGQKELYCHYFAKAMLFPKSRVGLELGGFRRNILMGELIAIKEQYGISIQALLHRLKDLQFITEHHYTKQRQLINEKNWKVKEPGTYYGKEHSSRMLQLIYRGIAEEIISTSKAANLYGMNLANFRRFLNNAL